MEVYRNNLVYLLGLFFLLSTLYQGPTGVLAGIGQPANDPLYTRPQGLLSRPRLSKHPSLPPIREEAYDPLYKRPGELDGRTRGLKQPSLPRIPEEATMAPSRWQRRVEEIRMQLLRGGGPRPITAFIHHLPWGPQAQGHGHGNLPPGARNRAPFGPNHRGRG
ncbi:uncharacterized protein LOC119402567 isoform X2 [Rhipicephalus sanguineus]|uniref:uncharacterized protein LOC119402567 isoform X2 n=1 Tax=Rhipicephalus sanguineus TaxID=34632 RepID=UPI0020C4DA25|nr:uncharacterized protein LOC119402567 isoform X2 [Rhipicephalus sanguineus]XP_049274672.1 uncharacterized protein LOC119402567 isoform X2 [Rhipicephalus sanguineus]XP_049274673.1 uncharacterized protein LOC119402567 isoform X2 [Rhipicephalus sanguineus]